MKSLDYLKRKPLGWQDGKRVYSRRDWHAFFISLIAGDRTVVMNATITGIRIESGQAALITNTKFVHHVNPQ